MKKKHRYRFEMHYSPKEFIKAQEFLEKCDLNIGQIVLQETFIITGTRDLTTEEMKAEIKKAVEETGGLLFKIEGGKIE